MIVAEIFPLHHAVERFDSPLQSAAARCDSPLHNAAERFDSPLAKTSNLNNSANLKPNLKII